MTRLFAVTTALLMGVIGVLVGLLLLLAAAGKSALVPFSGWLPRAMEGPTPSSAVFYGALSVHLGAFLLLRVSPILDESLPLQIIVTSVGVTTAILAALAAGANANAAEGSQGQTALMYAARENHAAAVKVLVEAGADVNARSKPA